MPAERSCSACGLAEDRACGAGGRQANFIRLAWVRIFAPGCGTTKLLADVGDGGWQFSCLAWIDDDAWSADSETRAHAS